MAKVIYHTESAMQIGANEMACSVSNEKKKPFPNRAAVNIFGLQKAPESSWWDANITVNDEMVRGYCGGGKYRAPAKQDLKVILTTEAKHEEWFGALQQGGNDRLSLTCLLRWMV